MKPSLLARLLVTGLLLALSDLCAATTFTRDQAWPGTLPDGWKYRMVSNISGDSKGRIYVAQRAEHSILVFDRDGKFLHSLGDEVFKITMMYDVMKTPPAPISLGYWIHGIYLDPQDNAWVIDYGRHVLFKFSPEGKLLMTLGTLNQSGADEKTFYQPAGVAVGPKGDIYVADGYGNSRVVKFSPDGKFVKAWGKKGSAPGEFNLPHGIAVDAQGKVYVAERLNKRVQVFDADGNFLAQWADIGPSNSIILTHDGAAYVGAGRNILKIDLNGKVLETIGNYEEYGGPHGLYEDAAGNLYVADPVSDSAARPPRRFLRDKAAGK